MYNRSSASRCIRSCARCTSRRATPSKTLRASDRHTQHPLPACKALRPKPPALMPTPEPETHIPKPEILKPETRDPENRRPKTETWNPLAPPGYSGYTTHDLTCQSPPYPILEALMPTPKPETPKPEIPTPRKPETENRNRETRSPLALLGYSGYTIKDRICRCQP